MRGIPPDLPCCGNCKYYLGCKRKIDPGCQNLDPQPTLTCPHFEWKHRQTILSDFEHLKNHQSSNSTPVNLTIKVQNGPSKFKHLNQNLNFTVGV
jgi:hypothetical protein